MWKIPLMHPSEVGALTGTFCITGRSRWRGTSSPSPLRSRRKILLCYCSPRCRRDRSIWLCTSRIACYMRLGKSRTPPLCGSPTGSLGLCPKIPSLRPWSEGRPWSLPGQLLWGVSSSVWLSPPQSGGVSPSGGGLPLLAVLACSVSLLVGFSADRSRLPSGLVVGLELSPREGASFALDSCPPSQGLVLLLLTVFARSVSLWVVSSVSGRRSPPGLVVGLELSPFEGNSMAAVTGPPSCRNLL